MAASEQRRSGEIDKVTEDSAQITVRDEEWSFLSLWWLATENFEDIIKGFPADKAKLILTVVPSLLKKNKNETHWRCHISHTLMLMAQDKRWSVGYRREAGMRTITQADCTLCIKS